MPRTPEPQPRTANTPPEPARAQPILCRVNFPMDITAHLFSWGNPETQVTNSDLDMVNIVLHHTCMADFSTCTSGPCCLAWTTWRASGGKVKVRLNQHVQQPTFYAHKPLINGSNVTYPITIFERGKQWHI